MAQFIRRMAPRRPRRPFKGLIPTLYKAPPSGGGGAFYCAASGKSGMSGGGALRNAGG